MSDHLKVVLRTVALALLFFALAHASPSAAAESPLPTRQQVAMNVEWASHLAPEDIPPVDQRAVICLVDSGVDVTPDLPASRPEGPVVGRLVADALRLAGDDEDGQAGRSFAAQHGTRMASYSSALPGNNWGTAGLIPWVRVISIRAMSKDDTVFPSDAYQDGIRMCQRLRSTWPQLSVVSLSFGCNCDLDDAQQSVLDDAVGRARASGLTVVAAAGNSGGSELQSPASTEGVEAATAGDNAGERCRYGTWTSTTLVAPGCQVDSQDGRGEPVLTDTGGSSSAAVFLSSVIAFLQTMSPTSSSQQVNAAIRASSRSNVVDAAAAAQRLGLGGVVDRAERRLDASPVGANPQDPPNGESVAAPQEVGQRAERTSTVIKHFATLARPRLKLRFRSGRLRLTALNRPRGADLEIRVAGRYLARRSAEISLRIRRWTSLSARYISDTAVSPPVVLHAAQHG